MEFLPPDQALALERMAIGSMGALLLLRPANLRDGGRANTSRRFMRWRVGLKFLAIVVVMTMLLV